MLFLTSLWRGSRFCWFDDVGAHGVAKVEQGALRGAIRDKIWLLLKTFSGTK